MNQILIELQAILIVAFLFSPIIAIFLTPKTKIIGFVGLLWMILIFSMFQQIG
jgi:hypothetical protein